MYYNIIYIGDFTDDQIEETHDLINEFCDMRRTYFPNMMTNYLHVMESGELISQLKHHRNLFRFCCIGVEACIGIVRRFILNRTQRGGATGAKKVNGPGKVLFTNAKAMGKMMLRKVGRTIASNSTDPHCYDKFYLEGKRINNAIASCTHSYKSFALNMVCN